jgi:bifunctional non-homologous end joining protein LigD
MGLQVYRKKRKFDVTPEPRGGAAKAKGKEKNKGNRFVVQKHAARRLHYDFRLELDGVMKSWAVTRGPSLVPGEKRLAVHVEDHPIEYNTFEGTIPQGEYGGGTVMIWDRGRWYPEGDPHKAYAKGHLDFSLEGEKLSGRWHLVRMNKERGETKEPWLLIKARDEAARAQGDPDILEEAPLSAASGRSMDEIAAGKGRKRVWHSNRSVAENVKEGADPSSEPRIPPPERGRSASEASRVGVKPDRARRGNPHPTAVAVLRRSTSPLQGEVFPRLGREAPLPDFVPPSLATLRDEAPSGEGWVHEIKFDGYRMQARLERGKVRLLTRKGLDWTEKFPNVAAAVAALPARSALIDGEVVVEDARGVSSFSSLQAALKEDKEDAFVYYVFDLLHLDGRDLSELPLTERKAALARLVGKSQRGTIRLSEHLADAGEKVREHACAMGLEGIVSKRADAPYRSGRSDIFIKTKCANDQELVVGGFSPSTALANAIGALVVGYYDGPRLIYAGRVGTGYTRALARDLWKRLHAIERDTPPFDVIPREEARRRDIRWVEPRMVIETQLRGWTADGLVRQAAFKGVREDKPAREVVREVAAVKGSDGSHGASSGRGIPPLKGEGGRRRRPGGVQAKRRRVASNPHPTPVAALRRVADASRRRSQQLRTATEGRLRSPLQGEVLQSRLPVRRAKATALAGEAPATSVRFTHPERVYWPDVGVTKRELADYYAAVWRFMAPQVVDRPLALVRCPDGTAGECFFQKHASAGLSEQYLKTVIDKNKRQIIAVEDLDGLLSLVQAGVLEVHVRGSLIDHLDLCDRIVFDLDPGPGIAWREVVAAAREVRERLAGIKLQSFVKLTGGKGLHVVLPIAGADWESAKEFAQAVAHAMAADAPERYVVKITKSLRTKKILVDYFRNSLEQTSVAAYSTRAREGAPVSVPVTWEELPRTKAGNQYNVRNLGKRLASLKADPWGEMPRVKQKLPDLRKLAGR